MDQIIKCKNEILEAITTYKYLRRIWKNTQK